MTAFHPTPYRLPLCFLLFLALLSGTTPAMAKNDPAQCPKAIGRAIDTANLDAFNKVVDLDAIIGEGVNVFLAAMAKPDNARKLPPMLAMMFSRAALGDELGNSMRTMLAGETRAFICNGIASGAFAGRTPSAAAQQGLLAPLFANASLGHKEIRSIGKASPMGSGAWRVPFVLHDGGNGHDYPITGIVRQTAHGMRLTGIDNFPELFDRIAAESQNIQ